MAFSNGTDDVNPWHATLRRILIEDGEYDCSQEPHPGRDYYRGGTCAECGYDPGSSS